MTIDISKNNPVFWAFLTSQIFGLLFSMIFLSLYCKHSNDYKRIKRQDRQDFKTFQNLRIFLSIICIFSIAWPFQYYFNFELIERVLLVLIYSFYDLGVALVTVIISLRIFNSYFKIKNSNMPWYYFIICLWYLLSYLTAIIAQILDFGTANKYQILNKIYVNVAIVWAIVTTLYTILMIAFLIKILMLFSRIHYYVAGNTPSNIKLNTKNNKLSTLSISFSGNKNNSLNTNLFKTMIKLCIGFIIYQGLLIFAYAYLSWNHIGSIDDLQWIISHDIIGRSVLNLTFYAYLSTNFKRQKKKKHHKHKKKIKNPYTEYNFDNNGQYNLYFDNIDENDTHKDNSTTMDDHDHLSSDYDDSYDGRDTIEYRSSFNVRG